MSAEFTTLELEMDMKTKVIGQLSFRGVHLYFNIAMPPNFEEIHT